MINPDQLHAFLEKIEQGVVAVDLLKIGQNHAKQQFSCKLMQVQTQLSTLRL